jgi:hypothetical protein
MGPHVGACVEGGWGWGGALTDDSLNYVWPASPHCLGCQLRPASPLQSTKTAQKHFTWALDTFPWLITHGTGTHCG